MDSVSSFKNEKVKADKLSAKLQTELNSTLTQLNEANTKLDESIKRQNAIVVFGIQTNKNVYTLIMLAIILGLLGLIGILVIINKRNRSVAIHAKNEYTELKEEFDVYKKHALDRYTKINTELHHTRLELNRKFQMRS